jgi:class 3 adenylate cyclase
VAVRPVIACPACGAANAASERTCASCRAILTEPASAPFRSFATVVNSDLKGSTALGEKLDPESLREVLTSYFDAMRLVFESHGGTIEKIIGDAIVAVFGVPVRRDDDALRAVEAAAESVEVLANLNDHLERTWGVRLIARTGVSTCWPATRCASRRPWSSMRPRSRSSSRNRPMPWSATSSRSNPRPR